MYTVSPNWPFQHTVLEGKKNEKSFPREKENCATETEERRSAGISWIIQFLTNGVVRPINLSGWNKFLPLHEPINRNKFLRARSRPFISRIATPLSDLQYIREPLRRRVPPGIVENHRFEIPRVETHASVKVQKLFVNWSIRRRGHCRR